MNAVSIQDMAAWHNGMQTRIHGHNHDEKPGRSARRFTARVPDDDPALPAIVLSSEERILEGYIIFGAKVFKLLSEISRILF
ncbi:hypothetical protein J2741_002428 [Methanolinea mesophila]|uniref:hypothetical protein n=1 Tax=Methanolinea mesophila TaxID=547055 RepID=UPI001AE58777|nr:hypothetical protein [Methanolinea mesophila]MBP1929832.1 hypothetical protein [Methanolinea mesophila]